MQKFNVLHSSKPPGMPDRQLALVSYQSHLLASTSKSAILNKMLKQSNIMIKKTTLFRKQFQNN